MQFLKDTFNPWIFFYGQGLNDTIYLYKYIDTYIYVSIAH